MIERRSWATEGRHPGADGLERRSTGELVALIAAEDARVPPAVAAAAPAIAALADAVAAAMAAGGRLVYVGAGASGGVAALDAYECGPTYGCAPGEVLAVVAGQGAVVPPAGLLANAGGAEDDGEAGAGDVATAGVRRGDAVVGLSASGRTPYVLGALGEARSAGALCAAVTCNPGSELARLADLAVEVGTGPEVIAGSTRMKAASAQKLVLHTLSTVVMIRLGRTYGPYMVAMRVENDKLHARATGILAHLSGMDEGHCAATLDAAGRDTRVAAVSLLAGCDLPTARRLLAGAGGRVGEALAAARGGTEGDHPFTAPAASPETTLRWTSTNSSTTGRV